MRRINLKIKPVYFEAVLSGEKTFEIRKYSDGFAVNDILILKEFSTTYGYTGREIKVFVTYVYVDTTLRTLLDGYCVLGISKII